MRMNGVLRALSKRLVDEKIKLNIVPGPKGSEMNNEIPQSEHDATSDVITHKWLWPRFGQWLQPKDIVITETGTANFGIMASLFPPEAHAISQYLWGSIGYATGAAQGAALAAKELGIPRTILWTGDGSLQLTAQAIATMLRNDLAPILFIICNKGYTIERFIHGMEDYYNDVQEWRYKDLAETFGARPGQAKSYVVKTKPEFEKLLANAEFSSGQSKVLRLVEVHMEKDDAPELLKYSAAAATQNIAS